MKRFFIAVLLALSSDPSCSLNVDSSVSARESSARDTLAGISIMLDKMGAGTVVSNYIKDELVVCGELDNDLPIKIRSHDSKLKAFEALLGSKIIRKEKGVLIVTNHREELREFNFSNINLVDVHYYRWHDVVLTFDDNSNKYLISKIYINPSIPLSDNVRKFD